MKKVIALLAMVSLGSLPAHAQASRGKGAPARGAVARPAAQRAAPRPEVGAGHIPPRGPVRTPARAVPAAVARANAAPHIAGHPTAPHVDVKGNAWIGYDTRRNEVGLRLSTPWAHGRFGGEIGASHVYRLGGGDRARFGFDGAFWGVASVDYGYTDGWLWNSDDIVLYPDPDHDGYDLAYNVRLGTYVHVEYLGA
jgi:hypothetical protein